MSHNIATPVHKFFEDYLTAERGLSSHTVLAYRDSMKLFLAFASEHCRKTCIDLNVEDLTADCVRSFLDHLETKRQNSVRSRNARLAVLHSFFRYLPSREPSLLPHCQMVLGVRFKRHANRVLGYLEREEVMHIFKAIKPEARGARRK